MSFTATYSPDDNKLRLYASSRLDADLYARVKAAGFSWAPKQELFVAPMWTPSREDLLIELAGEVGDDDISLVERAEERAERFGDYSDNRAADAASANAAVSRIADNIPLGQPILVGHHSEKHARRDAARIESGMRRAVKMWDTSVYWTQRAAGAISNAKYKELPAVRARRIKTIEADKRKMVKADEKSASFRAAWLKVQAMTDPVKQTEAAKYLANYSHVSHCFTLAEYPRELPVSQYEGDKSLWSAIDDGIITGSQAAALALPGYSGGEERRARWLAHYNNRLEYERAMLAEQVGAASAEGDIMGSRFDIKPGGRVLVRSEWLVVVRVNKSGANINSVTLMGSRYKVGIESVQDYKAPEGDDSAKVKAATTLGPLCNYPGENVREVTKAEWDRINKSGSGYVKKLPATDTHAAHRRRYGMSGGGNCRMVFVFVTDIKRVDPPAAPLAPAEPVTFARQVEPAPAPVARAPEPAGAGPLFDAMRASLKAGVKVVSAPQLFPTPAELAARMVELAAIEPGHRVADPEAGTGVLLDAVRAAEPLAELVAVEINDSLCSALSHRFPDVRRADFMGCNGELGAIDRFVMNPPFVAGQDMEHIRHAFGMLKPGGRLVAICGEGGFFRSDKQSVAFRAWLDEIGAEVEQLPEGTFAAAGTGVRCRLIVADA